jgi:hypothetical protein
MDRLQHGGVDLFAVLERRDHVTRRERLPGHAVNQLCQALKMFEGGREPTGQRKRHWGERARAEDGMLRPLVSRLASNPVDAKQCVQYGAHHRDQPDQADPADRCATVSLVQHGMTRRDHAEKQREHRRRHIPDVAENVEHARHAGKVLRGPQPGSRHWLATVGLPCYDRRGGRCISIGRDSCEH